MNVGTVAFTDIYAGATTVLTHPRASVTVHDGRAYALGAAGNLHCVDAASGKLVWKGDLRRFREVVVGLLLQRLVLPRDLERERRRRPVRADDADLSTSRGRIRRGLVIHIAMTLSDSICLLGSRA